MSRDSEDLHLATRKTIPVLPLAAAPFSVHLMCSERASDFEPFVRLGADNADSRAYLAQLRSATGVALQLLVLRLPELVKGTLEAASHSQTDSDWRRRFADLERFGAASRHFPQLILPATPDADHQLPPMIYCRERQRFFGIPCPRTLEPLASCRDDRLLGQNQLPLYSASPRTLALLYNPLAENRGEELTFYVAAEQAPEELAELGVKGLADLRGELAESLERLEAEGQEVDREDLPSLAGDDPWRVFTDRDSPYLITHFYPYDFDRFADYLGGRPTDGLEKEDSPGGEGYLFALEGSGLDAVEILLLKLTFFSQVVSALDVYYQELQPHLDLHPGHLVVDTVPFGADLPRRWGFQVKLLGLSSSRSRRLPRDVEVMMPPRQTQVPYGSPRMRSACGIQPRTGELVVERLHPDEETPDQWYVQGRLRDPSGILPRPSEEDYLTLEWPESLLGSHEPMLARCHSDSREQHTGELTVLVGPIEMDEETRGRLEQARGLSSPGVRYRIYPRLGVPEDVYSLGVLLLRLLLVNDQQDLSLLEPLIAEIPVSLAQPGDEATGDGSLLAALRDHPNLLASRNIFYKRVDREKNRPNALPEELWQEALELAWRLVGRSDFGLESDGGYTEDQPTVHLREVKKRVHGLLRQLRLVLFRRQPMHYEIHSLIAEQLAGGAEGR